jgi:hypothetical protein
VTARVIFGFWHAKILRKSFAVQGLTRPGVVKKLFGTKIPSSIEALIEHAHAPRDLIAARDAAKSEGA